MINVGIGHDHHVVFCAAQRLNAFAVVCAGFIDVIRNRCGADEADGFDIRVFQQGIHRLFIALHHVEHAVGQTSLFQQIGQHQ